VHAAESVRPYDEGAVAAAMLALRDWDGKLVSEQAIDEWLRCAYETEWGHGWADAARKSRDEFAEAFLTFLEPFHDRSEFAGRLDEQFDTVEILLHRDVPEYRELESGEEGDPMLAAGLFIPVSLRQKTQLGARLDEKLGVLVAAEQYDSRYDERNGLDLSGPPDVVDTIL